MADNDISSLLTDQQARQELFETKEKYQFLIEGTNVGTWEWNVQSGEIRINKRWAEIVGHTLEELKPTTIDTWLRLAHPDDVEKSNQALHDCFSGHTEFYDVECRMQHKKGHWIWVLTRGKVFLWTADGEPLMMYGTHTDISEQKSREEKLRKSEQAFSNNFHHAGIGMAIVGVNGDWLAVNWKLCEILGYTKTELLGLTFQEITFHEDLEKDLVLFDEIITGQRESYQIEKRYLHKDGHTVHTLLSVAVVRKQDGLVENFISQIIDISALRQAQDQINSLLEKAELQNQLLRETQVKLETANAGLLEQSMTDPLTSLGNRRLFKTALDRELKKIERMEAGKLSVIILDVDYFKSYNDNFGHPEGDRALIMLAEILSKNSRAYDIVTRFGGEEFAILLPDTDKDTANQVAERLRRSVENNHWPYRSLTISLGICSWFEGIKDDELLKFADSALYLAKQQGRNRSNSWLPADNTFRNNLDDAS